ncbi:hypothetical protein CEXT_665141 [Caerostris extrusa]|uniref:Uncharacterized protein n=1 Tax=Caerostris extrusa TaxID=172846 RepID=A0AAV4RHQ7_CAEEX|nr:hypothetical protein CEXT_665141 [Caerostris extrusa]
MCNPDWNFFFLPAKSDAHWNPICLPALRLPPLKGNDKSATLQEEEYRQVKSTRFKISCNPSRWTRLASQNRISSPKQLQSPIRHLEISPISFFVSFYLSFLCSQKCGKLLLRTFCS